MAIYIIALGTGGIKPRVSSLGADQFDETDDVEKKKKSFFSTGFIFQLTLVLLLQLVFLFGSKRMLVGGGVLEFLLWPWE